MLRNMGKFTSRQSFSGCAVNSRYRTSCYNNDWLEKPSKFHLEVCHSYFVTINGNLSFVVIAEIENRHQVLITWHYRENTGASKMVLQLL